jgi:hypothetical protein
MSFNAFQLNAEGFKHVILKKLKWCWCVSYVAMTWHISHIDATLETH